MYFFEDIYLLYPKDSKSMNKVFLFRAIKASKLSKEKTHACREFETNDQKKERKNFY